MVQRKSVKLQSAVKASCSVASMYKRKNHYFEPAPPNFYWAGLITVLLLLEFPKNLSCPSGKLRTEFSSSIAKSTYHGLSDMTFLTCCIGHWTFEGHSLIFAFLSHEPLVFTPLLLVNVLSTVLKMSRSGLKTWGEA